MQLADTFIEEFDLKLNQLRRYTGHGPSVGRFTELLLINLLRKYFPKSLDYSSGFIQGMNPTLEKSISSQIDLICFDRINFPIAFDSVETVVVLPSSVKGLVEIKSTLTSSSIKQILDLSTMDIMNEIPIKTKIYLLSTKSSITIERAFEILKTYYKNKENKLVRTIGGIYSLDWESRIYCNLSEGKEFINYDILHLQNTKTGLAPFILDLITDLFGPECTKSIANITASSLNKIIDSAEIKLYSSTGKL